MLNSWLINYFSVFPRSLSSSEFFPPFDTPLFLVSRLLKNVASTCSPAPPPVPPTPTPPVPTLADCFTVS